MWRYILQLFIYMAWIPSKLLSSVTYSTTASYSYVDLSSIGIDAAKRTFLMFSVKICNDAHIGLFTDIPNMQTKEIYEIVIGGWGNTKSKIRKVKQGGGKVTKSGSYLNCNDFVQFWISWGNGTIRVGLGYTIGENLLMQWTDPSPYVLNYVAISGWSGVSADWILEDEMYCTNEVSHINSSGLLAHVSGYYINAILTYVCSEMQTVKEGNLERSCLENGTWSGKEPTCDCDCECRKEMTPEKFSELISDMKIEVKSTSKHKRKKVSAPDQRPSSKSIGGIGVSILVFVACILIIPDMPVLYHHLKNMFLRNIIRQ